MNKEKSLAFVLMLDTSGSMWNDMEMVKIDAKAFVRQARKGDQFAINKFCTNASWVYPTGSNPKLVTVSGDLHETKQAANYIESLSAGGVTAMGDAISLGNKIMKNSVVSTDLKAYIILSDGVHNQGANPQDVLEGEPPVYIAALGNVCNSYFDKLIAKNPKSKFYNKPNAYQMMLMFNQIIADSNDSELILNEQDTYQKGADYVLKTFDVSDDDNAAQVNVVWSDKKYEYTSGLPKGNSINIVLIDPDNKNTDIKPDIAEDGYCIYNLKNVKPGRWKVLIQYSVPEVITGTVGGVDFYTDIKTNLMLPAGTGGGTGIRLSALNAGNPMENVKVTAQIARSVMSYDDIMNQYEKEMDALRKDDFDDNENGDEIDVMEKLREEILRTEHKDIFAKQVSTHELALSKDGEYVLESSDEESKSGIYNVDVKIEGVNPKNGLPLTRLKSGAFFIE